MRPCVVTRDGYLSRLVALYSERSNRVARVSLLGRLRLTAAVQLRKAESMTTHESEPLRVLGYVRCSTAEQSASGLGLAAQEAAIRYDCDRNGWTLVDIVHDDGVSAKDLHRLGLRSALE